MSYESVLMQVTFYLGAEDGWAGEGSKAPSERHLDGTKDIIRELQHLRVMPPTSGLDSSGEVSLLWDFNGNFIDLSVDDSEEYTYSYYIKDNLGREFGEDEVSSNYFPTRLLSLLPQYDGD